MLIWEKKSCLCLIYLSMCDVYIINDLFPTRTIFDQLTIVIHMIVGQKIQYFVVIMCYFYVFISET